MASFYSTKFNMSALARLARLQATTFASTSTQRALLRQSNTSSGPAAYSRYSQIQDSRETPSRRAAFHSSTRATNHADLPSSEDAASSLHNAQAQSQSHTCEILEGLVEAQVQRYLSLNPTSRKCLDLVTTWQNQNNLPVFFDHLAFRTFGMPGLGIDAAARLLEDLGYTRRDFLRFPAKKLRAFWFSPPSPCAIGRSLPSESFPALPRVFVSEIVVEELSTEAQEVIHRYTSTASSVAPHAFALSPICPTPWPRPSSHDFLTLARESEYAAWTLVNGFSLNHTTISVHMLGDLPHPHSSSPSLSPSSPLDRVNALLEAEGVKLNEQGGTVKVSPDGLLLQSSTVADSAQHVFSDGVPLEVPLSYMEFALRLPLPHFAHLPPHQIVESHRRDGFEVGNADKIFESTSSTQHG